MKPKNFSSQSGAVNLSALRVDLYWSFGKKTYSTRRFDAPRNIVQPGRMAKRGVNPGDIFARRNVARRNDGQAKNMNSLYTEGALLTFQRCAFPI